MSQFFASGGQTTDSRDWWLTGKASACQCKRLEFDPWFGMIPGEENGNLTQYSCLGDSMDREAWGYSPLDCTESDMT